MLDHCPFDDYDASQEYDAYLQTPLGYLRTEVAWRNLSALLEENAIRTNAPALDAGCGTGSIARRLAQRGHSTLGLDPSASMLDLAKEHSAELDPLVRSRLRWQQGNLEDLHGGRFALIVCHCALEFIPNRSAALQAMSKNLLPGGLLSILSPNGWAEPFHRALKGAFDDAKHENTYPNSETDRLFGASRSWYYPDELARALEQHGLQVIGYRGVRIVSDHLPPDLLADPDYLERLIEWEVANGGRDPFRCNARYLQMFARKPTV